MIVTVDFETYYSQEYSLSKMRTEQYVLDPRYQTIMCAVKLDAGATDVHVGHDDVARRFREIDWSKAAVLSHNMRFDGSILAWHYGVRPKLWLDSLSIARATTHAVLGRSSLEALAKHFELPAKGREVKSAIGLRLEDFPAWQLAKYVEYCRHDADLCYHLFMLMGRVMPRNEIRLQDYIVRMFVEPQVHLNPDKLRAHLVNLDREMAALMATVNALDPKPFGGPKATLKSVFSSSAKFKLVLEHFGVEVPMKVSPATMQEIPALAKGDREFKDLCADPAQPPFVQALLAARIGVKSTIEQTRTTALLSVAEQSWPANYGSKWMPVPLRYYGAHTGRLSGDGGLNLQNVKRDSLIKEAIEAPRGMRIVHRDASQIEARMLAWLAGCTILVEAFRMGRDVYSEFASEIYGYVVTKQMKKERFVGKTGILGLGYQTGAEKLKKTLYIGNGGFSVDLPIEDTTRIVRTYRRLYKEIPDLWASGEFLLNEMIMLNEPMDGRKMHRMRRHMLPKNAKPFPLVEVSKGAVWLPNGMPIAYPNLRTAHIVEPDGKKKTQKYYDDPYHQPRNIYGGKVTENIDQALARIYVMDVAHEVQAETDYTPFMTTHDSLDYLVPESEAQWWDDYLDVKFAVRPTWAPDLPLASEGGWGVTLKDAENAVNK